MSNKVSDFWQNLLLGGFIDSHNVYELSQVDRIPDVPGIYAWFLVVDKLNFKEYYKIYKQKKVKVNIEGNLKESYEGEVKNIHFDKDFTNGTGIDYDLCQIASIAFSPPLYIGISKELRQRLKQHTSELEKIYYNKVTLATPSSLGKTDFDTIVESGHFAQRIGFTIKSFPSITLNSLRIRTLEMPTSYTWTDLQQVEKYLNRTYIPIYGRK